jgi:hypothetical protein
MVRGVGGVWVCVEGVWVCVEGVWVCVEGAYGGKTTAQVITHMPYGLSA